MTPFVDVRFQGLTPDPSVESAIHRWVARLEVVRPDIRRAAITLEPSGRRRTLVCVTLALSAGELETAACVHDDVYVAVAEAFREMRHHIMRVTPAHASRPRAA